jgi:hypothetical protein
MKKWLKYILILIGILAIAALLCYPPIRNRVIFTVTRPKGLTDAKLSQFNNYMDNYCNKPSGELTGVDVYFCNDYYLYSYNNFKNVENPFAERPAIPAFCDKKMSELSGAEITECLANNP